MQSFLVICAICLQLSKLGIHDQMISQQKVEACNQCLTEVMKVSPDSVDTLTITKIFEDLEAKESSTLPHKAEASRCSFDGFKIPNDFFAFSEYYEKKQPKVTKPSMEKVVEKFQKVLMNVSSYEEEVETIFQETKSSVMDMIEKRIQKMISLFEQKKSEIVREVESMLSDESSKMLGKYSQMMDEIHEKITAYHTAPATDQKVINMMFDEVNNLVSQMETQLQDKQIMILSERLRPIVNRMVDSFDEVLKKLSGHVVEEKVAETCKNTLLNGQSLATGDFLVSENGAYKALMQIDGNLVIYNEEEKPIWHSNTYQKQTPNSILTMDQDGKLAIYDESKHLLWATHTVDSRDGPEHFVVLENDGKLVMYDEQDRVRWHTTRPINQKSCASTIMAEF